MTYREFHEQIQQVANGLIKLGVTKSDLILIFAENSYEYLLGEYAAMYLGVTFSQIPPACGIFEMTRQINDTQGTVLILGKERMEIFQNSLDDPKYREKIGSLKILIEMGVQSCSPLSHPPTIRSFVQVVESGKGNQLKRIPYFETKPTDAFVLMYTSGTTGAPKGAIHSYRSFLALILNLDLVENFPSCVGLLWNPLGHISGLMFFADFIQRQCSVVLHYDSSIESIMASVAKYRVNFLHFSPTHAHSLAYGDLHKRYEPSSLKCLVYGSCPTPEHFVDRIKEIYPIPVLELYGATEFMGHVTNRIGRKSKRGSKGHLQPGIEMRVGDIETGESLPPNQRGELCFRGPPCFVGYFQDEEKTKTVLDKAGWYHSGDLGYYDQDGEVFLLDRIKEMIKCHGFSVIPAEIEEFLLTNEAVSAVCVVGVKHVTEGQFARAYVQLVAGKQVTEEEIVNSVKHSLGYTKWLRAGVHFVHRMPLNGSRKIDRKYFQNLIQNELLDTEFEM